MEIVEPILDRINIAALGSARVIAVASQIESIEGHIRAMFSQMFAESTIVPGGSFDSVEGDDDGFRILLMTPATDAEAEPIASMEIRTAREGMVLFFRCWREATRIEKAEEGGSDQQEA